MALGFLPFMFVGALLPIATLILIIMTFIKAKRIERALMRPEDWEGESG